MKNILLFLFFLGVCLPFAQAQISCEPDTTLADSIVVYPLPYVEGVEGTGITDTACVNSDFATVIQLKIPPSFDFQGTSVPLISVDMATEGAIADVPPSMDYVCNPPNCVFPKDSTGCLVLFGKAVAGEEGEYDLKVNVTIRIDLGGSFGLEYTLPDGVLTTGNYYLNVKPEGSENCTIVSSVSDYLQESISLRNVPNPFGDYTEIRVSSLVSGDFSFEVYNLLGQRVHNRKVRLNEGANFIPFDGSRLSNGMYQYVLRNKQGIVSGKMMLSRGE